jgi:hypothetical protein
MPGSITPAATLEEEPAAKCAHPTFFMRVATSLLRLLLYTRAVSAVRCRLREFCLASTVKAAAATARCGRTAQRTGAGRAGGLSGSAAALACCTGRAAAATKRGGHTLCWPQHHMHSHWYIISSEMRLKDRNSEHAAQQGAAPPCSAVASTTHQPPAAGRRRRT